MLTIKSNIVIRQSWESIMASFLFPVAMASFVLLPVAAWDNGAARAPTRGWQNWNAFHNAFNASLTLEVAHFLRDSGLLAAGYEYITLGGMGFAEHGDPEDMPGYPHTTSDPARRPHALACLWLVNGPWFVGPPLTFLWAWRELSAGLNGAGAGATTSTPATIKRVTRSRASKQH